MVIHSRDAHAETVAILEEWASGRARPDDRPLGVIHCFSGDAALARRYVELGFAISFAGPVTYPQSTVLRQAVVAAPRGWIMVETDSPYLSPQGRRGRRNEPAHVVGTAAFIAGSAPRVAVGLRGRRRRRRRVGCLGCRRWGGGDA